MLFMCLTTKIIICKTYPNVNSFFEKIKSFFVADRWKKEYDMNHSKSILLSMITDRGLLLIPFIKVSESGGNRC